MSTGFERIRCVGLIAALAAGRAQAEWVVGGYLGASHTVDSALGISQPDGKQSLPGVGWESRSLEAPPYYGLQVAYFFAEGGPLGLRVDFCHDKVYAHNLRPVLQRFSISHGLNSLTLDVVARIRRGRMVAYAGFGAGTVIPHVEAVTSGGSVDEYQWFRGIAAKPLAGVQFDLAGPIAVFAELRLTWVYVDDAIPNGDLTTRLFTQHAVAGALLRL